MNKPLYHLLLIATSLPMLTQAGALSEPGNATPAMVTAPAQVTYEKPGLSGTVPPPAGSQAQGGQMSDKGAIPMPGSNQPMVQVPAILPVDVMSKISEKLLPLMPEEIKQLHKKEDDTKRAHAERAHIMPRPVSRSIAQTFAPGQSPAVIRLAPDFTTTVVFTDSSGAAWPVKRVIVGNKESIQIPELDGSAGAALKTETNIITLTPLQDYISTNITFLLEGASAPVTMMLVSGQPELDMRLDVSLRSRGPNAVAASLESSIPNTNLPVAFSAFLDGVPPDSSKSLKSSNAEIEAWVYNDKMMVRTKLELLSPYVYRRAKSPDGTGVFEVAQSPVVLVISNGRTASVNLSGFPPPNIEALRKALDKSNAN